MRKFLGMLTLILLGSIATSFVASTTTINNITLVADKTSATVGDVVIFNLTLPNQDVSSAWATGSFYINNSLSQEKVYFSFQWNPTYPYDTMKGDYSITNDKFNVQYTVGNITVHIGSDVYEIYDGVNYTSPVVTVYGTDPDITPPEITYIETTTPSVTGSDTAEFIIHASDTQNAVNYMWGHLIYTDEINNTQDTCYPNLLFQRIDYSNISDVT